jgi:hypothetical protein
LHGVVSSFTTKHRLERGRAFATKLVKRGHLIEADIERAVSDANPPAGATADLEP